MTKTGRPIANNVDYFPHKCKDDKAKKFDFSDLSLDTLM